MKRVSEHVYDVYPASDVTWPYTGARVPAHSESPPTDVEPVAVAPETLDTLPGIGYGRVVVRIHPPVAALESAVVVVGGQRYAMDVYTASSWQRLEYQEHSDDFVPLFSAGGTIPVDLELTAGGNTLTHGVVVHATLDADRPDAPSSGYDPNYGYYGPLEPDTFVRGNTTHTIDELSSQRVVSNWTRASLSWTHFTPKVTPPFWTGFMHAAELIGGPDKVPGLPVEPEEPEEPVEPEEPLEPEEPNSFWFDVTLAAEDMSLNVGLPFTGYLAEVGGSVTPGGVTIAGTLHAVDQLMWGPASMFASDASGGTALAFMLYAQDISPLPDVTSVTLIIDGVPLSLPLDASDDQQLYALLVDEGDAMGIPALLTAGSTVDVRVVLEGMALGEPVDTEEPEEMVLTTTLVAGAPEPGSWYGADSAGFYLYDFGSLDPAAFAVDGAEVTVDGLTYTDAGDWDYPYGPTLLAEVVARAPVAFSADRLDVTINGQTYALEFEDAFIAPAAHVSYFILKNPGPDVASVIAPGETYDVTITAVNGSVSVAPPHVPTGDAYELTVTPGDGESRAGFFSGAWGAVSPASITIDGTPWVIHALFTTDYEGDGSDVEFQMFSLEDPPAGVVSASLVMDGVAYPLVVEDGFYLWGRPIAVFEPGVEKTITIYIETGETGGGETPEEPVSAHGIALDFDVTVADFGQGVVGAMMGEAGEIEPMVHLVAGEMYMAAQLICGPAALLFGEGLPGTALMCTVAPATDTTPPLEGVTSISLRIGDTALSMPAGGEEWVGLVGRLLDIDDALDLMSLLPPGETVSVRAVLGGTDLTLTAAELDVGVSGYIDGLVGALVPDHLSIPGEDTTIAGITNAVGNLMLLPSGESLVPRMDGALVAVDGVAYRVRDGGGTLASDETDVPPFVVGAPQVITFYPRDAVTPPYEPVGTPHEFVVTAGHNASWSEDVVGFVQNNFGSASPATITHQGSTLSLYALYTFDDGEGWAGLEVEFTGADTTAYNGIAWGVEVGDAAYALDLEVYTNTVRGTLAVPLDQFVEGETYTITLWADAQ